ncbi:hypothetical protein E2C01_024093 [Portunus trituberculatus]|uniref:Uncharacterized protein n=1 Tax=Portunus trituberculatus TaxID=210409 RepID=A0A5B7EDH0_PORTR|nr:hypothetical protein [Portunus trituberculatus]
MHAGLSQLAGGGVGWVSEGCGKQRPSPLLTQREEHPGQNVFVVSGDNHHTREAPQLCRPHVMTSDEILDLMTCSSQITSKYLSFALPSPMTELTRCEESSSPDTKCSTCAALCRQHDGDLVLSWLGLDAKVLGGNLRSPSHTHPSVTDEGAHITARQDHHDLSAKAAPSSPHQTPSQEEVAMARCDTLRQGATPQGASKVVHLRDHTCLYRTSHKGHTLTPRLACPLPAHNAA